MSLINRYRNSFFATLRGSISIGGTILHSVWSASIKDASLMGNAILDASLGAGVFALSEEAALAIIRSIYDNPSEWPRWAKATQCLLPTLLEFLMAGPVGRLILEHCLDTELLAIQGNGLLVGGFILFMLTAATKFGIDKYGFANLTLAAEKAQQEAESKYLIETGSAFLVGNYSA